MKKVRDTMLSTDTPISSVASVSWAQARMAMPSLVLLINRVNATRSSTVEITITICTTVTLKPNTVMAWFSAMVGY